MRCGRRLVHSARTRVLASIRGGPPLPTNPIGAFAVDEAHIVAAWSQTFRPAFGHLGVVSTALRFDRTNRTGPTKWPGTVPIVAMTATATPRRRSVVKATLGFRTNTFDLLQSLARKNVSLEYKLHAGTTRPAQSAKIREVVDMLRDNSSAPILVFVNTVARAHSLAIAITDAVNSELGLSGTAMPYTVRPHRPASA